MEISSTCGGNTTIYASHHWYGCFERHIRRVSDDQQGWLVIGWWYDLKYGNIDSVEIRPHFSNLIRDQLSPTNSHLSYAHVPVKQPIRWECLIPFSRSIQHLQEHFVFEVHSFETHNRSLIYYMSLQNRSHGRSVTGIVERRAVSKRDLMQHYIVLFHESALPIL